MLQPDEVQLVLRAIECAREVASGDDAAASAEARPTRADGAVRVAESYLGWMRGRVEQRGSAAGARRAA